MGHLPECVASECIGRAPARIALIADTFTSLEPGAPPSSPDDIILELAAPRISLAAWLTISREFPIRTGTVGVYVNPGTVSVQNCTPTGITSRSRRGVVKPLASAEKWNIIMLALKVLLSFGPFTRGAQDHCPAFQQLPSDGYKRREAHP